MENTDDSKVDGSMFDTKVFPLELRHLFVNTELK